MKKSSSIFFFLLLLVSATHVVFGYQPADTVSTVMGKLVRVSPKLKDIDTKTMYGKAFVITRDENGLIGVPKKNKDKIREEREKNAPFSEENIDRNAKSYPPNAVTTAINQNYDGQTWSGFGPTDNNLAVGPNHVIQMINDHAGSKLIIYDKAGNTVQSPITLASITGMAGYGDPIVVYDQLADRWLLTEFGGNPCCNTLIIAVSTTNNPTGSYAIYQYTDTSFFPDYPKYSVWNNEAYFARSTDFTATTGNYMSRASVFAFDRQAMLNGSATATMIRMTMNDVGPWSFYYMNIIGLDGTTPSSQGALFATPDFTKINLREFVPNFTTPASSVINDLGDIPITSYNLTPNTVVQPSGQQIQTMQDRLMYRLSYRNRNGIESIVMAHTVRGSSSTLTDVNWYELRRNASTWGLYQQGRITSADGQSRFMPGIAQDANGNISVMYNVSGNTTFPSIRYVARNECDPLGQMTLSEQTIVNGTVNHTYSTRWGDYNTLAPDPTISGSFWGTAQYGGVPPGGRSGNATRISNFTINAGVATFSAHPQAVTVCAGSSATFNVAVNASGAVTHQWQRSIDNGANWTNISGATAAAYSFNPTMADDGHQFRCIANRTCGTPGTSNPAVLTMKPVPNPPLLTASGPTTICNGGSVTLNANVGINNALNFVKANSQYVSVPHSASLNLTTSFTMEAWVNYSGSNATILDKGNYDYLWSLNANGNGNKMGFYELSTGTWKYSNGTVPENTWTHVAIILNAGTLTFYINGVASGTASTTISQDNQPLNIGRQQPTSCACNHFNGTMDELRIWNVARTYNEIIENMNNTIPTNSAGLVAYYKFDEGTGTTTTDATSNGNNGTLVNYPTWQVASPLNAVSSNSALNFTKSNSQYVTVPHSASLNLSTSFTMEAWVNYSGVNSTIIDKGNYNYLWQLNANGVANGNTNQMGFFELSTGTWKYSTGAVPQNTWTHVAITLNGGTLTFYINGVASGTASVTIGQDTEPLNIGRQQPTFCACNHFNGTMDELRIWNIVRTPTQIIEDMNKTIPTNSAGLVAYYKFDEGTGTTTADATSNGNNGTLVNNPTWQVLSPVNSVVWSPSGAKSPVITTTTAGTYIATIANSYGCTSSSNVVVSVGSNAALVNLTSPADDYSTGILLKTASIVNGKITAINKVTGSAKVDYRAKSIELNNGFKADNGTVFSAAVGGCN